MRLFYKEKLGNGCRAIYFMGWRICYYKRNPDRHRGRHPAGREGRQFRGHRGERVREQGRSGFRHRAVGVPARVVRLRFTPEQREKIVESKYWLLPPEEAKAVIRGLGI